MGRPKTLRNREEEVASEIATRKLKKRIRGSFLWIVAFKPPEKCSPNSNIPKQGAHSRPLLTESSILRPVVHQVCSVNRTNPGGEIPPSGRAIRLEIRTVRSR